MTPPERVSEDLPEIQQKTQPIINGSACGPTEQSSSVAIILQSQVPSIPQKVNMLLCTGTLIAPDVVLSAAHCLDAPSLTSSLGLSGPLKFFISFTADLSYLTAAGSGGLTSLPGDAIAGSSFMVHPDFDLSGAVQHPAEGLSNWSDVGLIFLSTRVQNVAPAIVITEAERGQVSRGATVTISGWGQQTAEQYSQTNPPPPGVIGYKRCATSMINEAGQYEMQVGSTSQSSRKCHGDSGGPTYMTVVASSKTKERVIGITSHAYDQLDCANSGGIDTRVDAWLAWIDQEMKRGCQQQQRVWCDTPGIIAPDEPAPPPPLPEPRADLGGPFRDGGSMPTTDTGEFYWDGGTINPATPAGRQLMGGCQLSGPALPGSLPWILLLGWAVVYASRRSRR
jgi:hypothetical protein